MYPDDAGRPLCLFAFYGDTQSRRLNLAKLQILFFLFVAPSNDFGNSGLMVFNGTPRAFYFPLAEINLPPFLGGGRF